MAKWRNGFKGKYNPMQHLRRAMAAKERGELIRKGAYSHAAELALLKRHGLNDSY
ncbi:hypothetical protein [Lelliottia nimipressuralis]|uniref:Uncharacterized protein n=1 Tax=Lelliottia nimipressuralis TaxID=69220 RepID=A0ABD4K603_9ENTR|nr:hypothetical protein [Lelliottia nimipressuralis]MBF4177254.1 hypothetical protein [Lelliottia nimipressuralis]